MTTLLNHSQATEQLAYLGFAVGRSVAGQVGTLRDAVRVTRERKTDLAERGTDRKVFQCLVVGAKDAGKVINTYSKYYLLLDSFYAVLSRSFTSRCSGHWAKTFTICYK